jgi:hypothetical protein
MTKVPNEKKKTNGLSVLLFHPTSYKKRTTNAVDSTYKTVSRRRLTVLRFDADDYGIRY